MKVVILTTFDLDEYVFEALQAGASGFLLKDLRREDLVHAVRGRRGGRGACSRRRSPRGLIEDYAARGAPAANGRRLGAHTARAGGPRAHRERRQQHGDRRDTVRVRGNGEDARRPGPR